MPWQRRRDASRAEYLESAKWAVRFLEEQQHDDGGWRYSTFKQEPSDVSVTGWQVLALKAAIEAGIPVREETLSKVDEFIKSVQDPQTGITLYQPSGHRSDAMVGVGMLHEQFLLHSPHSPFVTKAANYLAAEAAGHAQSPDYYLLYNCTLAMFQAGGQPWNQWNGVVRNSLLAHQEHAGCARGSWRHGAGIGARGGRVCSTAWAVLTLEVYYRFGLEQGKAN